MGPNETLHKAITRRYRADLDSMSTEKLVVEAERVQEKIDKEESWLEAITSELQHRGASHGTE